MKTKKLGKKGFGLSMFFLEHMGEIILILVVFGVTLWAITGGPAQYLKNPIV